MALGGTANQRSLGQTTFSVSVGEMGLVVLDSGIVASWATQWGRASIREALDLHYLMPGNSESQFEFIGEY